MDPLWNRYILRMAAVKYFVLPIPVLDKVYLSMEVLEREASTWSDMGSEEHQGCSPLHEVWAWPILLDWLRRLPSYCHHDQICRWSHQEEGLFALCLNHYVPNYHASGNPSAPDDVKQLLPWHSLVYFLAKLAWNACFIVHLVLLWLRLVESWR